MYRLPTAPVRKQGRVGEWTIGICGDAIFGCCWPPRPVRLRPNSATRTLNRTHSPKSLFAPAIPAFTIEPLSGSPRRYGMEASVWNRDATNQFGEGCSGETLRPSRRDVSPMFKQGLLHLNATAPSAWLRAGDLGNARSGTYFEASRMSQWIHAASCKAHQVRMPPDATGPTLVTKTSMPPLSPPLRHFLPITIKYHPIVLQYGICNELLVLGQQASLFVSSRNTNGDIIDEPCLRLSSNPRGDANASQVWSQYVPWYGKPWKARKESGNSRIPHRSWQAFSRVPLVLTFQAFRKRGQSRKESAQFPLPTRSSLCTAWPARQTRGGQAPPARAPLIPDNYTTDIVHDTAH